MESDFEMEVRQFLARRPFGYRMVPVDGLALFCAALTHDSYTNERGGECYERLEFLGDAILEFIACENVYLHTDLAGGAMTDFKQDMVANRRISERVLDYGLDLDGIMRVGGGHMNPDGTRSVEENMRADCFEALLAAIYLTYGMDEVRRVVGEVFGDAMSGTDPAVEPSDGGGPAVPEADHRVVQGIRGVLPRTGGVLAGHPAQQPLVHPAVPGDGLVDERQVLGGQKGDVGEWIGDIRHGAMAVGGPQELPAGQVIEEVVETRGFGAPVRQDVHGPGYRPSAQLVAAEIGEIAQPAQHRAPEVAVGSATRDDVQDHGSELDIPLHAQRFGVGHISVSPSGCRRLREGSYNLRASWIAWLGARIRYIYRS